MQTLHRKPAVSLDCLAGDVARIVREKEGSHSADLFHCSITTKRNLLEHLLLVFIRQSYGHVGLNQPQRERVHGNISLSNFLRQGFCKRSEEHTSVLQSHSD